MIVVDASAAITALLNSGPARDALDDQQIHVPHLIDSEVVNGLRRLVSAKQLQAAAARSALDAWQRLGMTRYPVFTLIDRIWHLRENLSAYDASYIALTEELGCALLTADARLSRAPGIRCPITLVPR